jgi:transposase
MAAGKADGSGGPGRGGDGAEVAEDSTQVVEYAAAIDVAKGSGMVCTRVPGSRPDRRRQKVWRVEAMFNEVTALMDQLRCEGIQRLVLESTSDYWRIWYYLAEAAGLAVWLVNVKHLPGRGKSDAADCVWLCKLNERGMLRRSFVPPQPVRDLRALTRTRARLAQDQARHQARVEKILEDRSEDPPLTLRPGKRPSRHRTGERPDPAEPALSPPREAATRPVRARPPLPAGLPAAGGA